jgi:hypothetical protein
MLPMIGGLLEKILIPFFIFGQKEGAAAAAPS